MTGEKMARMEAFIESVEGNLSHVKRVLHICTILAQKENMDFDEDVLVFAAYFHDISAYPPYAPAGAFDHALESGKLAPDMAKEWGYGGESIEKIVEAVKYHDKAGMGKYNETRLIRNADGIDYLGFMAVARDFVKQPKDMNKAMAALKKRETMFAPLIDLESAREMAEPRITELNHFIGRFEEESFGIY